MRATFPIPYLQRIIPVPASAAGDALDDVLFERHFPGKSGARRWTADVGRGRISLVLPGTRMVPKQSTSASPVRSFYGSVRPSPRLRRIRIELEVVPWSSTACTIGIRALGRRSRRRPGYERTGSLALERLREEIERRVRVDAVARNVA